ncbi:TRAFAC clade GTPase domain-containing protein, partial [Streptomyces sp. NRRL F-5727]|uniref:TRAFAC clade GTPase domain-containing protein n=1 Tax=Streptomyces sp. NRRL F-5727 TaxID=1463871 RepID=UPI0004CC0BD2
MDGGDLTWLIVVVVAAVWAVTALVVCVFRAFWKLLAATSRAAVTALGPLGAGRADQRVIPIGAEPAHPSYWARQLWIDTAGVVGAGLRTPWRVWHHHWMKRVVARLFQGRRPTGGQRGGNPFTRAWLWLMAPGTALGATVAVLLVAVLHTAALLLFGVLVGLLWAGWAAAVGLLRGAERARLLLFRIRPVCPHPGCHRPVPLAAHRCPHCPTATHRELRPGRYGVFRHTCECGQRLPASPLTGRGRIAAECPSCDRPLPPAAATTRVVHVPLIGASSSGKTMLMAAVVAGLRSWATNGRLTLDYASDADRHDSALLDQRLRDDDWALKTQGDQRAWMILVGKGRQRRLLYLYDPMGEALQGADRLREQQYLAHADGVLFVVDVLADRAVRQRIADADGTVAAEARPAAQGPVETFDGLSGELTALVGRRGRLPVAVVVTKRDVLDRIPSLPPAGAEVDTWLTTLGLGGLVRNFTHQFRTARYWSVSAFTATGTGALDPEGRRAAEPVLWLLARSGLRVGALVDARDGGAGVRGR